MATELPRPGVEIIQQFTAASPTIARPTLVPCVVGAAKEIVEVTNTDGTLNTNAKQGTYSQLPLTISQTSFPSPRDNIAEVDVEEASIRAFLLFGGKLTELERSPGEGFLVAKNSATRPAVRSEFFTTSTGLTLDGKILVIAIDVTAPLNTTRDVVITFAGSGNLTPTQIVDQINDAVGAEVASEIILGSNSRIQIASTKYGAAASVTVRAGGSANATFGFSVSVEYRVTGSGFRAQDLSNNTTLSPWVEWTPGAYLVDSVSTSIPAYDDDTPTSGFGIGFLDSDDEFATALVESSTTFTSSGMDLKIGDEFVVDGVLPNTSAVIMKVEASRFKLGILNTKLSVVDATTGTVTSAVYDQSSVNTLFASTPFAPRYAWFKARGLTGTGAPTEAELTGTTSGAAATTATIESPAIPAGSTPYALAGLTLKFDVTVDGVAMDTQTFTFTGGPFADLAAVVTAVGTNVEGMFAHTDLGGTKIAFSTDSTGATQELVLRDDSTALVALGFAAATEYSDAGTDVEFSDIAAALLGGTQTFPFTAVNGETLIVQLSADGGGTYPVTKTYTFATGTLSFANIGALVTELGTATRWAGAALPTEFAITAVGAKLKITSTATGSLTAIRIGSASTAIGATSNSDLRFTSLQADVGEENLNGQRLQFKLNDRPRTYDVTFTSDSLVDAVELINQAVGTTVASIGGDADDQLVLTSTLKGYASKVEVVESTGVTTKANNALGFGSGNRTASGTGRPNPDFSVDVSGNVVLGAEILRSSLTGAPFDPSDSDIYIQYTGLRKDVSPVADNPGLLRISDVTTLDTVLSPINSENPLALGLFFALINAPGFECSGIGVDAISAAAPEGTLAAFTRAANFLESQEVYAIAPLTSDVTVHQMFKAHIETMSAPDQKGERILFVCPPVPTREVDDLLGSGLGGGSTATENQFLLDVNVTGEITDRGLDPLDLSVDDNVFLEVVVESEGVSEIRHYSVSSVNGVLATLRVEFEDDENTDGYFTTATLSETLVNADWRIAVRGDKLLLAGSTLPDKPLIAETVAKSATAYQQRRMYYVFPDTVKATVGGVEQSLPGHFACAAVVGMVGKFAPQQGFTNLPITGFTGVIGSKGTFTDKQLNQMAGGGAYILVQDAQGAPITCRHQVSTNLTSVETRELSVTKVVDFCAKFLRAGLRNFIGTFNITQPFLDTLSTVIQGMLGFLADNGIIISGDLNNLVQSKEDPDTVLVDVTLDVPIPCNYIRLTLVI
jgi:hypothetical protein